MRAVKSIPAARRATSAATVIAAPQAGQIVGERYRLEEWLESGAMGSVWRAEQIRLRSPAAIKFLEPSLIEVPEMLERLLQEARSAAAVHSAHVIQVFDYGSEGGLPYIAMEFLEGENLDARLARRGVLTPAELDRIFGELARGLGHAHELGVIHRDVKPGNIFLAREGRHEVTKLIDFGIAKVKADALRVSQIVGTELGTLLGTPQYMSPEQMRGRSTVDYRTDLWSLAIIACECLTGRYPFAGTSIGDLTVQICTEQPPAPSTLGEVPAGFDQWFFQGTSKDPSERFESAAEMAEALTKILVPRERAAESVRRSLRLVRPRAQALRQACSAGFSLVLRRCVAAFARARDLASSSSVILQAKAGGLTRSLVARSSMVRSVVTQSLSRALRRPSLQRLWSPAAALGLALLIVTCGLVLSLPRRRAVSPTLPADMPTHAMSERVVARGAVSPQAVSPQPGQAMFASTPLPAVAPAPVVPSPEPVTRPSLPVLKPEDLPLLPETEVVAGQAERARAAPAKTPEARRPANKRNALATSTSSEPTPSSPMSSAMRRLGAIIAQGGDKPHPTRAKTTAAVRVREGARAKTE